MKLIQHLLERLLNWLTNGRLDELRTVKQALADCEKHRDAIALDAAHARAQLMQLRVENSDPSPLARIGWQVSAFIPQAVVDKLTTITPEVKEKFTVTVASKLVDAAIAGIFRVNSNGGTTALVFEPVAHDSSKRVLTCWFEGDKQRPGYIAPESSMERLQRLQDGSPEYKSLFAKLLPSGEK